VALLCKVFIINDLNEYFIMVLSELQEKWLVSLETSPAEKQTIGKLGVKVGDSYTACCLGELHVIACKEKGLGVPFGSRGMIEDNGFRHLLDSFKEYGLVNDVGWFKEFIVFDNRTYHSLSELNDMGVSWKEIAKIIRENPENVFTNE
jgi:hypothetical protein